MNVPTIACEPEVARAKLEAYRDRHKDTERVYSEAAAAMQANREAARRAARKR